MRNKGIALLWVSFFGNVLILVLAWYLKSKNIISIGNILLNMFVLFSLYVLGKKSSMDEKLTFGMFLQAGGVLAAAMGVAGAFLNLGSVSLSATNTGVILASLYPFIEGMIATGLSTVLTSFLASDVPSGGAAGTVYVGGGASGVDPALVDAANEGLKEFIDVVTELTQSASEANEQMKNMGSSSAEARKNITNIGKLLEDFGKLFFAKGGTP